MGQITLAAFSPAQEIKTLATALCVQIRFHRIEIIHLQPLHLIFSFHLLLIGKMLPLNFSFAHLHTALSVLGITFFPARKRGLSPFRELRNLSGSYIDGFFCDCGGPAKINKIESKPDGSLRLLRPR